MSSRNWIIPLPLNFDHRSTPAVGLIPCHGIDCREFPLVRLDRTGKPYAPCDATITVRKCKRRYDLLPSDIPDQTIERVLEMAADVATMPREHREYLAKAWNVTTEELINGSLNKTSESAAPASVTEPAREIPSPAGISKSTGESSEPAANPAAEPIDDDDTSAEGRKSVTGDRELDVAMGYSG